MVSEYGRLRAARPSLHGYLWALGLLALGWGLLVGAVGYDSRRADGVNLIEELLMAWCRGVLVLLGLIVMVWLAHWLWRLGSLAPAAGAAETAVSAPDAAAARRLQAGGEQYVLEIRGLGLMIDPYGRNDLRKRLFVPTADPRVSVLSQDPKDYPPELRDDSFNACFGAAVRGAALDAVEYWPLPVIMLTPPMHPLSGTAAEWISELRQQGTLGVTLPLYQDAEDTESAEAALERLFAFFDQHPDVPQALVFGIDGDQMRDIAREPGYGSQLPKTAYVPQRPDSFAGLLVTRSDRVEQLMRPYAVSSVPFGINLSMTQYDTIKLWNFFWSRRTQYDAMYVQAQKDKGVLSPSGPSVPKADWWAQQLPTLWQQLNNRGPGAFKPSLYLPVRWTDWQVGQFERAPRLGYLHRPVRIELKDAHGQPLRHRAQVKALRAGWQRAMATLGPDEMPQRVFYDSSYRPGWIATLYQALYQNAEGIDLDQPEEGFDMKQRIGDTGVVSALAQIGLAVIAGYDDGKTSATVNLSPDGYASIVMVSPATAEDHALNQQHGWTNPFVLR